MHVLLTQTDFEFTAYRVSTNASGSTPTDFGYMIHLVKLFQEFTLVFFNVYMSCYFELFLINLGRIFNSPSLAGNLIVTFLTEITDFFFVGSGPSYELHVLIEGTDPANIDYG